MVKGSVIAFVALVISALFALGLRMFLTRALSVEAYGLFFAVLAVFLLLTKIPALGLGQAMTRYLPEFRIKKKFNALKSSIAVALLIQTTCALLIAVPLFIFSEQIAIEFFGTTSAIPIIRILCVWFIALITVRLGMAILTGFRDIFGSSFVRAVEIPSVFIVVAALSICFDIDAVHVAAAYLLSTLVMGVWIFFRFRKHSPILRRGKASASKSLAKKLLAFGLPLIIAGAAVSVIAQIDTLVITAFRTVEEVGVYQVAYPLMSLLSYFGVAIGIPLLPMLAEMWAKKDKGALQSTFYFLTKFLFIIMIPVVLIVLAFPGVIIGTLFGADYLGAALSLQILCIAAMAQAVATIPAHGLKVAEQTVLYGKTVALAATINLIGDILLVPVLGIEGAAISTLLAFLLTFLLEFYFARRFIKFPAPLSSMTKAIVGGILTLFLVFGLKLIIPLPPWPKLFAVLIPAGLFYIAWIFATRTIVRGDLKIMRRAVPVPRRINKILRKIARD